MKQFAEQFSFIILIAAFGVAGQAFAGVDHAHPMPVIESPGFLKMQNLVGTWEGSHKTEKGMETIDVNYELSSGKTALVEKMGIGSPMEMVTVYHPVGKGVEMTHYCMLGNQPHMKLSTSDDQSLTFSFADGTNMKKSDPHMHSMKLTWLDRNRIQEDWTYYEKGKLTSTETFVFTRKN